MSLTIRDMMGASVAAMRINGKYYRKDSAPEGTIPNSVLMSGILAGDSEHGQVLPEDLVKSDLILEYLSFKVMDLIAGNLEDYWRSAVMLLDREEFHSYDGKTIAFMASIPTSYDNATERERVNAEMNELARYSSHLGSPGDAFPPQPIAILGSIYSKTYMKHYHTALAQENKVIRFPLPNKLERGQTVRISGKIHKHGDSNTTVLHYVRICK